VWSPIRFTRPGARNQRRSANTRAGCRNSTPRARFRPLSTLCDTSFRGLAPRAAARRTIDQHKKRVVENEILFRDVNERLKGVSEGFGDVLPEFEIICECGDAGCTQRISMTLKEYEQLRSDSTHFAVRRGHESLDVETIIEDRGGYLVVRKDPGRPAELARQSDPHEAQ
jgi:hypothetical protein